MIGVLISVVIIFIYRSEAKKKNKSIIKWTLLGVASFWLTALIPSYIFVEYIIGERSDKVGIGITVVFIFGFLIIGGLVCNALLKRLKRK